MPAPARHPILARGLVKRFGDLVAVDHLDLAAPRGTCLALLGPNGAGKTTTIEMLEGLTEPDAGEVRVLGMKWKGNGTRIRSRIGVQLQDTQLQDKLSVFETLRMFRSFYADTRDEQEVMEVVGLREKADARIRTLSGGQKQRLTLGCALVNRPEVLFLDEPTTGLDPQARRRVWQIVEEFKAEGGTLLLTTHYMEEAERLADDVCIVDRGEAIARGSPRDVIRSLGAESIVEFTLAEGAEPPEADSLRDLPPVLDVRSEGRVFTLSVAETQTALQELIEHLREAAVLVEDIRTHRPTLEDVFVALTGKHLRDG